MYLPESASAGSEWSADTVSHDSRVPAVLSSSFSEEGGGKAGATNGNNDTAKNEVVLRRTKAAVDVDSAKNGVVLRRAKTVGENETISTDSARYGVVLRRSKTVGGAEEIDSEEAKYGTEMRQNRMVGVVESTDADSTTNGVVMRRTKNLRGQRNRKSALHGDDIPMDLDAPAINPLGDANVRIISVSPEHTKSSFSAAEEGGAVIESRAGRVLDLVKEFDEKEAELGEEGEGLPHPQRARHEHGSVGGEEGRESFARSGSSDEGQEQHKKPKLKAFDMFEKSGLVMGMVRA